MKFNLGCGWRNFGKDWIHVDGGDYDHLDNNDIYLSSVENTFPFQFQRRLKHCTGRVQGCVNNLSVR